MDKIDAQLLEILQRDCSQPYSELAKQVGLSITPVVERLKKLRARGYVRAHVALVDPRSLGYHISAFVAVELDPAILEANFIRQLGRHPNVQEFHGITGEYSVLLKIRALDAEALERFINEHIRLVKGVRRVRVELALSTHKETSALPVPTESYRLL